MDVPATILLTVAVATPLTPLVCAAATPDAVAVPELVTAPALTNPAMSLTVNDLSGALLTKTPSARYERRRLCGECQLMTRERPSSGVDVRP